MNRKEEDFFSEPAWPTSSASHANEQPSTSFHSLSFTFQNEPQLKNGEGLENTNNVNLDQEQH